MVADAVHKTRRPHRTKNDLRCFCRRKPLLAVYGLDAAGNLYVHVMVYKQDRIFGNLVVRGGPLDIQCRECMRWHVVNFMPGAPTIRETQAPVEVDPPPFLVRQEE